MWEVLGEAVGWILAMIGTLACGAVTLVVRRERQIAEELREVRGAVYGTRSDEGLLARQQAIAKDLRQYQVQVAAEYLRREDHAEQMTRIAMQLSGLAAMIQRLDEQVKGMKGG